MSERSIWAEREQYVNSPTGSSAQRTDDHLEFSGSTPSLESSKLFKLERLQKENIKLKTGLEEAFEQLKSLREEAKNTARARYFRENLRGTRENFRGTRRRVDFYQRCSGELPAAAGISCSRSC